MNLNRRLLASYHNYVSEITLRSILLSLNTCYNKSAIFPDKFLIFKAFKSCPKENVKVIIIGQDPYPQKGYATGLAFANPRDTVNISPSLSLIKDRIFKDFRGYNEGMVDLPMGDPYPPYFDITLESWAKQGVLLLNSSLTVEENKPGSHSNLWYPFMKEFISRFSLENPGTIYVLFGKEAKILKSFINKNNTILEYNHPTYYLRTNKEFDCNTFTKVNEILFKTNKIKINWK